MPWFMSVIYDRFMKSSEEACLAEWRADLLGGLSGEVLEVGAGTGANLRHYPREVQRLVATEPDRYMIPKLRKRAEGTRWSAAGADAKGTRWSAAGADAKGTRWSAPGADAEGELEIVETEVERMPFPDASFDAVVSTLVLCSVNDLDRSIAEIRRVLRPGGALVFLEHVAAEDRPDRYVWQRRVEPLWKRVAGNCHLTRRTGDAIRRGGFEMEREIKDSMRKANAITRATIRGVARKSK